MNVNDGGPAFPTDEEFESGYHLTGGMSLRDYFAAAALTGTLANPGTFQQRLQLTEIAQGAYNVANAMLAERAKRKEPG